MSTFKVISLVLLLGLIYFFRSQNKLYAQSCSCCEPHWNPMCVDGWTVERNPPGCDNGACHGGQYDCVCGGGGGGGGGCDANNWGGCNVSCGWGSQSNDCGDTQSCWAGSCCTNSNPSSPTLLSPTSNSTRASPLVPMTWQAPASWGNNCSGNSLYYIVYFGTSATPNTPITCAGQGSVYVPSSTTSCTYSIPTPPAANTGTTYYWRVATYNNGLISYSSTWSLKYVYPGIGVIGGGSAASALNSAVWDATALGASCAQNDAYKASKELIINNGDVTYSSALPNSASITIDGTRGVLPTYKIKDAAYGAGTVCVNTSHNTIAAGLSYVLSCADVVVDVNGDGVLDGAGSSSVAIQDDKCVLLTSKDVGIKLDLGFKLIPIHWINSVDGGDVFAGTANLKVPSATDTTGGFKSYLISTGGFAFGSGDLTVTDAANNTDRISETGGFAENIAGSFIGSTSFMAPTGATTLSSNCSSVLTNLDPAKAYQMSATCAQAFINSGSSYSLSKDGIAVVYVNGTASDVVKFGVGNKNFKSSAANRRILFVMNTPIEISSDLGYISPTTASAPNIEAGLVTSDTISFPGIGGSSVDTSVVLEGPLVSKKTITSTRNRFLLNTYPAIAVKYNTVYLRYIRAQELMAPSGVSSYTGKASYDVVWEYAPQD